MKVVENFRKSNFLLKDRFCICFHPKKSRRAFQCIYQSMLCLDEFIRDSYILPFDDTSQNLCRK